MSNSVFFVVSLRRCAAARSGLIGPPQNRVKTFFKKVSGGPANPLKLGLPVRPRKD
jgi:hypothetical protein